MYGYECLGRYGTCNRHFADHITPADGINKIYYYAMETNRYVENYLN